MRRLVTVLVALVLPTVLVGCSDDGGDPPAADPGVADGAAASGDDAGPSDSGSGCAALTEAAVGDAVGLEVTGASELPAGCQWSVDADPAGGSFEWQSLPVTGYEANRTAPGFEIEPVEDFGDEAFRRGPEGGGDLVGSEIWVRVGDQAFFVRSSGLPNSDEVLAGQEAVAGLLVDQLG